MKNTDRKDSSNISDSNELIVQLQDRVKKLEYDNNTLTDELFKSRQLFQSFLNVSHQRVFWKDRDLNFLGCNKLFAEDAGVNTPEDIKGKNDHDFIWKKFAELYRNDDKEVIDTAKPKYNYEEPFIRQDGSKSWLRVSKAPLFDKQGKVVGILGALEDITANKQTQEALQNERQLLRTLIDNIPDAFYVKDIKCRKTMANNVDIRNLGAKDEAELIGKDDFDFFEEEIAENFYRDDQAVLQGNPVINREEYFIDPDGKKRWLLTSKIPIRDGKNIVTGLVGIGRDITERKNAEEAYHEASEKFKLIFETAFDGISIYDGNPDPAKRKILDCNPRYAEIAGRTKEELLKIGFTHEMRQKLVEDKLNGGKTTYKGSFSWIRPDGKDNIIEYAAVPIKINENTFIIGIDRDVTIHRRAEEALQIERNLFKTLIDNQPDFIFLKDTEGRYMLNNLAHLKYLGVEKQEDCISKTVFDFKPKDIAEKLHVDDLKVIQSGEALIGKEQTLLYPNGETGWHLVSRIPIRDFTGNITGLLGVSHDITNRKKAEEALSQSMEKLAEYSSTLEEKVEMRTKMLSDKNEELDLAFRELKDMQAQLVQAEKMASLGQLTAGIAHEIKNPLNFVNNFARLSTRLVNELREEISKQQENIDTTAVDDITEILDDLKQNVTKIEEHGKRADNIIKGMLLHSRGKAGEVIETDINSLLKEYIGLAYHGFRAVDASFNTIIQASYGESIGKIKVVPQDISRVFLNIINNACYSTNEKKAQLGEKFEPAISVSTKDLNNKIEIQIRDNGLGIPKDILEKVFNPFFTTKPAGKGTGLGLSLSYDIVVQLHKGELKVDSEPGEFAEFTITLPKNL